MTQEFAELGLRPSLIAAVELAGYASPTNLQRMAIPVLRRGGNAVLYAAPGSSVTATWGLALLDRLAEEDLPVQSGAPAALVVVATEQRANQVASSIARLQAMAGDDAPVQRIRVRAFARGWRQPTESTLLVSSLAGVVNAVRASELKLEDLKVAVLEGVPTLLGLEGEAAMEALMVSVPHEAQHVVTSSENSRTLRHFVEAQVRKPMHFPPPSSTLDEEHGDEATTVEGVLSYLVIPEWLKSDTLSRLLTRKREAPPTVWTRTEERARVIARELARRGFRVGATGVEGDVVVAWGVMPPKRTRISYDVPFDAEGLAQLDAQDGLVMVQAREIAHLRMIARQADREVRAVGRERTARDALAAFRADIRRALNEEDLELHLAALEPLFAERSAEEVAAALSAIARRRVAAPAPPQPQPVATKAPITYTKLFVSTGQRDGIRPVDIVGAITGETGLKGDRVGRVDIRDTFSVVEVDAESAERVIRALNGITMKGRSLRVDYDRRTSPGGPALKRRPPNSRSPQ